MNNEKNVARVVSEADLDGIERRLTGLWVIGLLWVTQEMRDDVLRLVGEVRRLRGLARERGAVVGEDVNHI